MNASDTITLDHPALDQAIDEYAVKLADIGTRHVDHVRSVAAIGQDRLALAAASAIVRGKGPAYDATISAAEKELSRLVGLKPPGKFWQLDNQRSHSQQEFASSLREERQRTKKILHHVTDDPKIQEFWREREHYKRPPELTVAEQRELDRLVRRYFDGLPTVAGMIETMQSSRGR